MEQFIGQMVKMPAYNGATWKKDARLMAVNGPIATVKYDNRPYWGDKPSMITRVVLVKDLEAVT